ncbi:amino acid ABC transporter ATP-binding protein [Rothia santali]|nr:amino acid ABC transporter ATP-binding protein [Rothia santali]
MPGTVQNASPFLEAEDIWVEFNGKPAVKGISMRVDRGEVVAIIGPSGSGKSTFLRCINHLQAPTSGTVKIDGISVREGKGGHPKSKELTQLRRRVGMVFQQFNLFPNLTAVENIMLAQVQALGRTKKDARGRALALLDRVGLEHRANHYPGECSGGQQQRIAIARALALDPMVLLFDEPTSALDPELGAEVLGVMKEMASEGMTMIVVTHEMSFAEDVADRVAFIADGAIVEQGNPKEVLRKPQHSRTQRFLKAVLER